MNGPIPTIAGRVQLRRTSCVQRLKYYIYVPKRLSEQPSRRLLVAVHGISRNARGHALSLASLAESLGVPLVAPLFDGPNGEGYQRVWSLRVGLRADRQLDRIVGDAGALLGASFRELLLWGYSGGAQFAHRYAMAYPNRIAALALGAPGWYTMPRRDADFPFGLRGTNLPHDVSLDAEALVHRPIFVCVGDADNRRDRSLRCDDDLDAMQGRNRIERARRWTHEMSQVGARQKVRPQIALQVIPDVGHDFDASVRAGLVDMLLQFFRQVTDRDAQRDPAAGSGGGISRLLRNSAVAAGVLLSLTARAGAAQAPEAAATPAPVSQVRFRAGDGLRVGGNGWLATLNATLAADGAASVPGGAGQDELLLRRARISAAIDLGPRWDLRIDRELSSISPGWTNLWLQWRATGSLSLRLGSQHAPFGLEDAASFRTRPFAERSLAAAFTPGTLVGVTARFGGGRTSLVAGVFRNSVADDDRRDLSGASALLRGTTSWRLGEGNLLHAGASVEYRRADSGSPLRLRSRPETMLVAERLVDTRDIANVDTLVNVGLDAAWRSGPVLLQAEYTGTRVRRSTGNELQFSGGYASASWVVTGERRSYSARGGSFGEIRPRRALGAFEVALRASTIDLDSAEIRGGSETNLGAALNWYPRENARVMINYLKVSAQRGNAAQRNLDLVTLRADFSF